MYHPRTPTSPGRLRRQRSASVPKPLWRRTDAIAVFVSILALVVSGATWLTTERQLRLTSGQVRAYVQILDAELSEPLSKSNYHTLDLKVKNVGQTAAVEIEAQMFFELGPIPTDPATTSSNRRKLQSLGPGVERVIRLTSLARNHRMWPKPQYKYPPTFLFYGSLWTTDDTTKERRREDWCYVLKLRTEQDLETTKVESCEPNAYRAGTTE